MRLKDTDQYVPALDGLRFLAFLAVFFHHLPNGGFPVVSRLQADGWVGVDLFFVISACLFFRLLGAEYEKTKKINIQNFFIRRMLRLYPLMIVFPAAMMVLGVAMGLQFDLQNSALRWLGLATFVDNFATYIGGYNQIPYSAHLWTLSYEFQVYLAIPWLFLVYLKIGGPRFLLLLGVFWLLGLAGRLIFYWYDAPHPIVWVTPFLRPESVLLGLAISTGVFSRAKLWIVILVATLAAGAALLVLNQPYGRIPFLAYPPVAIMVAAMVWLALYNSLAAKILSQPTICFLGKISFGLYVFHIVMIAATQAFFNYWGVGAVASYFNFVLFAGLALALTTIASITSYYCFEYPFLRMKLRFTVVHSRSI